MSYTPMLTAGEARAKARQDRIIFDEIRNIESAVLDAVDAGSYEISVTGTLMTDTSDAGIDTASLYYGTWAGVDTDRSRTIQMSSVVSYFTDIGYAIEQQLNVDTGITFNWFVAW